MWDRRLGPPSICSRYANALNPPAKKGKMREMNSYTITAAPLASIGMSLAANVEVVSQAATLIVQIVLAITALVGLFVGGKSK